MKKYVALVVSLINLSTPNLWAAADCSQAPEALTIDNLVIAYDHSTALFVPQTARVQNKQLVFNELRDSSCIQIQVSPEGEVRCLAQDGQKQLVGNVWALEYKYQDLQSLAVFWNDKIKVMAEQTAEGCVYGVAVR